MGISIVLVGGLVFFFIFSTDLGDGLERTMEEGENDGSSEYEAPLSYGDSFSQAFISGLVGFLFVLCIVHWYGRIREPGNENPQP